MADSQQNSFLDISFSILDKVEHLRTEGGMLISNMKSLRRRLPLEYQSEVSKIASSLKSTLVGWDTLSEELWTTSEQTQLLMARASEAKTKARLRMQQAARKEAQLRSSESELRKTLTAVRKMWRTQINDLELSLNEQQQFRLRMQSDHEQYLSQANSELENTFDKLPKQSFDKLLNQSFDKLPNQSFDKFTNQSFDKLPSQSFDKMPSQSFDKFLSKSFDQLPSQSFDNLPSQSFDKLIEEYQEDYSRISMEKDVGHWASEFESSSEEHQTDVKNALNVLRKAGLLSDREQLLAFADLIESGSLEEVELALQLWKIQSKTKNKLELTSKSQFHSQVTDTLRSPPGQPSQMSLKIRRPLIDAYQDSDHCN